MLKKSNNNNLLDIACAIDDAFSYPLAVMLISCLENNKQHKIKIHLFSANLSSKLVKLFERLVESYAQKFCFYPLTIEHFKKLPTNERISLASYYRLIIPEIIKTDSGKFLYLDADIIVVGSLRPLFEVKLNNKILAAVNDVAAVDMRMHLKHNIPENYQYFNAGVLLINKPNWIKNNATSRILNYITENKDLCLFHDQDGLNAVLFADRKSLSPKWNQQVGIYFSDKDVLLKCYSEDLTAGLKNPIIIHFNGSEKPWHQVSNHPFRKKFKSYAQKNKNIFYTEKFNLRKRIKKHIIYGLFGWINVNRYYYKKAKKLKDRN